MGNIAHNPFRHQMQATVICTWKKYTAKRLPNVLPKSQMFRFLGTKKENQYIGKSNKCSQYLIFSFIVPSINHSPHSMNLRNILFLILLHSFTGNIITNIIHNY